MQAPEPVRVPAEGQALQKPLRKPPVWKPLMQRRRCCRCGKQKTQEPVYWRLPGLWTQELPVPAGKKLPVWCRMRDRTPERLQALGQALPLPMRRQFGSSAFVFRRGDADGRNRRHRGCGGLLPCGPCREESGQNQQKDQDAEHIPEGAGRK